VTDGNLPLQAKLLRECVGTYSGPSWLRLEVNWADLSAQLENTCGMSHQDAERCAAEHLRLLAFLTEMRGALVLIIKMYGLRSRDYFGKMPGFPQTLILINFGADLFGPKLFQKMLFLSRGGISGRLQYSMSS
jgi:hypothetical protein